MNQTIKMLRSVATTQEKMVQEITESMDPKVKAQVAATSARVIGTLCKIVADVLETDATVAEPPDTKPGDPSMETPAGETVNRANMLAKRLVARNDELRKAMTHGDWNTIDRILDRFIGPPEEEVPS